MQAVRSTGSQIEQKMQKALWRRGYRYRKNYKKIIGKPDITFVGLKIAVFVDSEFWHGYNWKNRKYDIKSRRDFWWNKIKRNMVRDKQVTKELVKEGWIVIRFWGMDVNNNLEDCIATVRNALDRRRLATKRI